MYPQDLSLPIPFSALAISQTPIALIITFMLNTNNFSLHIYSYVSLLYIDSSNSIFPIPNSSFFFSKIQSFLLNPNSVNGTAQLPRHLWFFPHTHLLHPISNQALQIQSLCISHIIPLLSIPIAISPVQVLITFCPMVTT